MNYQVIIPFDGGATCTECPLCSENDFGDKWCSLNGGDLVKNIQDPKTCQCEDVKQYSGLHPTWCPLVEVT